VVGRSRSCAVRARSLAPLVKARGLRDDAAIYGEGLQVELPPEVHHACSAMLAIEYSVGLPSLRRVMICSTPLPR
jgi:hypothetical protein